MSNKNLQNKMSNNVLVSRVFLQDEKLSYGAKGLLAYILSLDWLDFSTKDLIVASNMHGRDYIYKLLTELIQRGYVQRETIRSNEGKIEGVRHFVYPEGRIPNHLTK